ncbi:DUF4244 domain-containing protein [Mycobacterium sp.]|uniref:DUF4244 domain-containing protein n=1 Tax=Mycobacterium sp. TaxID=1785 RepID=UPI0031D59405
MFRRLRARRLRVRRLGARRLRARLAVLAADESGMSTVEYAIGTVAAAAFGAILYTVVTGDSVVAALTNIIARALNTKA